MTICKSGGRIIAFPSVKSGYYDPEYELTTADPKSSDEIVHRFRASEGLDLPEFLSRALAAKTERVAGDASSASFEAASDRSRALSPTMRGLNGPRFRPSLVKAGGRLQFVRVTWLEKALDYGTTAFLWIASAYIGGLFLGAAISFVAGLTS